MILCFLKGHGYRGAFVHFDEKMTRFLVKFTIASSKENL